MYTQDSDLTYKVQDDIDHMAENQNRVFKHHLRVPNCKTAAAHLLEFQNFTKERSMVEYMV